MRRTVCLLLLLLLALSWPTSAALAEGPRVVASTAWTAALARAAGATDITVIAPLELQHPPEYEIKPSDLEKVAGADLVVYAGYEKFAPRLVEAAGSEAPVLRVTTDNAPAAFKEQAGLIAAALGTEDAYAQWVPGFDAAVEQAQGEVQRAWSQRKAVVQAMLKTYAEALGFEVVGVFGPAEPSPAAIAELARAGAALVIDNEHNPTGKPIADTARLPYARCINFPGKDGTVTVEDVYRWNASALVTAAQQTPAASSSWPLIVGAGAAALIAVGSVLWLRRR